MVCIFVHLQPLNHPHHHTTENLLPIASSYLKFWHWFLTSHSFHASVLFLAVVFVFLNQVYFCLSLVEVGVLRFLSATVLHSLSAVLTLLYLRCLHFFSSISFTVVEKIDRTFHLIRLQLFKHFTENVRTIMTVKVIMFGSRCAEKHLNNFILFSAVLFLFGDWSLIII